MTIILHLVPRTVASRDSLHPIPLKAHQSVPTIGIVIAIPLAQTQQFAVRFQFAVQCRIPWLYAKVGPGIFQSPIGRDVASGYCHIARGTLETDQSAVAVVIVIAVALAEREVGPVARDPTERGEGDRGRQSGFAGRIVGGIDRGSFGGFLRDRTLRGTPTRTVGGRGGGGRRRRRIDGGRGRGRIYAKVHPPVVPRVIAHLAVVRIVESTSRHRFVTVALMANQSGGAIDIGVAVALTMAQGVGGEAVSDKEEGGY
mmetsp:Transcript_5234/g.15131  ORF Transcript_5234/g.15131 Transcript_5234/m.15131 type:complete len:257 (+) Transcript_5234:1085-1855(+)